DLTTSSRFMIWEMSWEGFKERPILGWGQENFLYVFSKYYDPKMWNQEPWFDRSHDVFFDWLIAGGALGLLSYLSMFGAAVWLMWRKLRDRLSVVERAILTGMLAGYFVHNIFVFDNLTSYLVFFALLGYLHALSVDVDGVHEHKAKKDAPRALEAQDALVATALIIAMTAGLVYALNIRNINANIALIDAIRVGVKPIGNGKFEIPIADVASKDLFGRTEAREQLGQMAFQATDPRIPPELRNEFYQLTSRAFEDEVTRDPTNMRTRSFAGMFYSRFGQNEKALEHYAKAIELSPTRQSTYIDLTSMYLNAGNFGKAVENAKIAYELEPAYPESRIFYAIALIYNNQSAEADEVLVPFAGMPQAYDQRIVNAYGNTKRFDKVIALVGEKIAGGDATGRDHLSLAGAYLELGQKQKAIEEIEVAITMDASLKEQGQKIIESIRTGKPI
ncbi:MAG TPA: O-antigen ligase family protein, partial [Candidatus Paceibacterota bacterium]|nr:O-antigen ligase family protein [Candidatus Paceibacterota bacterium]